MKELTARQKQILDFIQRKQDFERLTPTLREIAFHFRFSSPNAALAHVQALCAKGFLKNLPGRARSLQVVDPPGSAGVLPSKANRGAGILARSNVQREEGIRNPATPRRSDVAGHVRAPIWELAGETPALPGDLQIISVPIYGSIPAGRPGWNRKWARI